MRDLHMTRGQQLSIAPAGMYTGHLKPCISSVSTVTHLLGLGYSSQTVQRVMHLALVYQRQYPQNLALCGVREVVVVMWMAGCLPGA
jgi:hypothetical protein